jgi:hypothetical protein
MVQCIGSPKNCLEVVRTEQASSRAAVSLEREELCIREEPSTYLCAEKVVFEIFARHFTLKKALRKLKEPSTDMTKRSGLWTGANLQCSFE